MAWRLIAFDTFHTGALQVRLRPDLEALENFTMAKTERLILRD
jgi:hypothetical protein